MTADVVVIGGGVVGASLALALKHRGVPHVLVLERDPSYARSSSSLAFGRIQQLFATRATLELARRSLAFYRRLDADLARRGLDARVRFRQHGTLLLTTPASHDRIERQVRVLASAGTTVQGVSRHELPRMVPGLACEELVGAFFAPEDGVLEPRALLHALLQLARAEGVEFRSAELTAIETARGRVRRVHVNRREWIETPRVVCAAGAFSAAVGEMVGVRVPVLPVRQQLVRASLPAGEPFDLPTVVTPAGLFWRYQSAEAAGGRGALVCGFVQRDEPPGERFECDDRLWPLEVLPNLRRHVPAYRALTPDASWVGLYEMTPDGNPLIGEHPEVRGFWLACGFSGRGLLVAPAAGEALAAGMIGDHPDADLGPFAIGRFTRGHVVAAEALP